MSDLRLAVKKEYFDAIRSGDKIYEYRERTPYWEKRLRDREYDTVTITCGYPKAGDKDREHTVPYRGFKEKTILHPHFGEKPVEVFSIFLADEKE